MASTRKKTHYYYVEELKAIHPTIKVLGKYDGANIKLRVKCNICKHIWTCRPSGLLLTKGCVACVRNACNKAKAHTDKQFLDRLFETHGDTIIAQEPYTQSFIKLKVKCKDCSNVWAMAPAYLLAGTKCPECSRKHSAKIRTKTDSQLLSELHNIHEDTITAISKYKGSHIKMRFMCKQCCTKWWSTPSNILTGHGCPHCAVAHAAKLNTKTNKQFIQDLYNVHGNSITPLEKYTNTRCKMLFKCNTCDTKWDSTPSNILIGSSCPNCAFYSNKSFSRKQTIIDGKSFSLQGYEPYALTTLLNNYTVDSIHCATDVPLIRYVLDNKKRRYHPDLYIPNNNLLIEVKSLWTMMGNSSNHHERLDELKAKRQGVLAAGYKFKLMVYGEKGDRLPIPKLWYILPRDTLYTHLTGKH